MNKTAPTLANYEKALHQMLDENEALRAEIAKLNGQLSTLVDWIMGDADALTLCKPYISTRMSRQAIGSKPRLPRSVMNGRNWRRPA